jgi:small subunit ribosomal protein S16
LGVGAQPSEKVRVFLKKYGAEGTHLAQQQAARERLALPKVVPPTPEPVYVPPPKSEQAPAEVAVAAAEAPTEAPAESTAAE